MRPEFTPEEVERFWKKVDQSGGPDACWPWMSSRARHDYGQFYIWRDGRRRSLVASRVALELTKGEIPEGQKACHNCPDGDNPRCCNPAHLFLGTQTVNIRDSFEKGRSIRPGVMGTANGSAKLTEDDVRTIRNRHVAGATIRQLARDYGIARFAIFQVVRRLTWQHVLDS